VRPAVSCPGRSASDCKMVIASRSATAPAVGIVTGDWIVRCEGLSLEDIRPLGRDSPEDDRVLAKGSKYRPGTCLRRSERSGSGAGARRDLPKTHRSRSRQETSQRRPRTTASDGRAASRALRRPAWLGDGGHFSSLEPIPSLSPSFARRRLVSHRVDDRSNPHSKSARRMQHRCVLGLARAELEAQSPNRRA
jgi:hypothetical protein